MQKPRVEGFRLLHDEFNDIATGTNSIDVISDDELRVRRKHWFKKGKPIHVQERY